jgi:uncharacterized protein (DUF2236 family)
VIDYTPSADPIDGLFGPRSVTWQVDREVAVLLGSGSRALLMQVAHPLIAAAVADHSRYRSDPLGRLRDTLDAIYSFAFADTERALSVVQSVTDLHTHVVGTSVGGQSYSALDPHLLLWVYATLIDSSLVAYETLVAPLAPPKRETYYAEFRRAGVVWGIPTADFPPTLDALRAWMADLIVSGEVHVSQQGREAGRFILEPPVWWLPGPVALPLKMLTTWLLPPPLRAGFGYAWGPRREHFMGTMAALSREVVPRLPRRLRDLPIARAADRRVRTRDAMLGRATAAR